jgi:hypothetical protein
MDKLRSEMDIFLDTMIKSAQFMGRTKELRDACLELIYQIKESQGFPLVGPHD